MPSSINQIIWYSILTLIFVCPPTVSLFSLMTLGCKCAIRCSSKCRVDMRILDKWIQRESGLVGEVTLRSCCGHQWNVTKQKHALILPVCCILYWRFPGHAARRCPCRACILKLIWLWTSCRKDQKAQSKESKRASGPSTLLYWRRLPGMSQRDLCRLSTSFANSSSCTWRKQQQNKKHQKHYNKKLRQHAAVAIATTAATATEAALLSPQWRGWRRFDNKNNQQRRQKQATRDMKTRKTKRKRTKGSKILIIYW